MSTISTEGAALDVAPRHWQLAGGLALGHVALMLTGILMEGTPSLSEGEEGISRYYADGDMTRIYTGGYLELLAFIMLLPVLVFLARVVGQRTEAGRWASTSAGAFGVGYVAITIGSGFAPGAAALWGTHHGLDPTTALVVNDIRNFAYYLSLAFLGAHAVGLAVAALRDGWATRTAGWGGLVTGTILIGSVPFAGFGLADLATLVWIVWWIALAFQVLRGTRTRAAATGQPLAAAQ